MDMHFVSYKQLVSDIYHWSGLLPNDLSSFVGIPRSGTLVAHLLSLHRNIDCQGQGTRRRGGHGWQATAGINEMVLDDSVCTGTTFRNYRKMQPTLGLTGAVYCTQDAAKEVDIYHRIIPLPRAFEWNIFHCNHMHHSCVDMDGVLCRDPLSVENDDGPQYLTFLKEAAPLFLPSTHVHSIVTNRLEKYRGLTQAWLERHCVKYGELVMSQHSSRQDRIDAGDYGARKAAYYRRSSAYLFVESSLPCAKQIRDLSGKAVLCTDTMQVF